MQYFTHTAILSCTILTLFIHHVQGISPTEEVYDENYPHFLQTRKRIAELRKMGYFPESEISSNYIAVFLSDCLYVLRMFHNFMSMCVKYCYSSYIFSCIMISIAVLMCTELFFSKYLFGNNHSRRNAMRTVVTVSYTHLTLPTKA